MTDLRIYCRRALLADGWKDHVVLGLSTSGRIESLSTGTQSEAELSLQGTVIPGMPNLHSHGFQRMMAGMTGAHLQGADSFRGWREAMYRLANKVTPEQVEDCMAWVFAEMLTAGYTSCAEFHYLHHQPGGTPYAQRAEISLRVLAAANTVGLGLTLLPVLYCASGFGQHSPTAQQARFSHSLDAYLDLLQDCTQAVRGHALHRVGIAPHSLRAVPAAVLVLLVDAVADKGLPIHIHIAEQATEVQDCLTHLGARPVAWLLDNVQVDTRWCLVHATHINDSELHNAAHSGAVAGLCPTTEADLGDGFFAAADWLDAGGRFGIGSDSNLRISVSEELRLLEFSERLRRGRRNVLRDKGGNCGRFLYAHAARSGAQALAQETGILAIGRRADLVELDPAHPLLAGRDGDAVLESLLFAGGKEMVRSVIVGGRQLVIEGRHIDEAALRARFGRAMKALLSS